MFTWRAFFSVLALVLFVVDALAPASLGSPAPSWRGRLLPAGLASLTLAQLVPAG